MVICVKRDLLNTSDASDLLQCCIGIRILDIAGSFFYFWESSKGMYIRSILMVNILVLTVLQDL